MDLLTINDSTLISVIVPVYKVFWLMMAPLMGAHGNATSGLNEIRVFMSFTNPMEACHLHAMQAWTLPMGSMLFLWIQMIGYQQIYANQLLLV